jgi:NAD(P)-dependent dehydrogenase (short-subunit alcohol dehydrogenase family)
MLYFVIFVDVKISNNTKNMNQNWTISNIPDLSGKTIIVTGANSGLGLHAVKALAQKNAQVIMACRNIEKGEQAKTNLSKEISVVNIHVRSLDLMDLKSVKSFADKFIQENTRLDVLINNAGIMMTPYTLTKDGFESQLGTNHLGHFALTGHLLELLKSTPKSRVVNVSSIAHKNGKIYFDNLLFAHGKAYSPFKAYAQSKLANLLFTHGLQTYFEKNKIDCMALTAHPGVSDTNLFNSSAWVKFIKPLFAGLFQPAEMGALPELRAATDPGALPLDYYGPNSKTEMKGYPVKVKATKAACDAENAQKLWKMSEELTQVFY